MNERDFVILCAEARRDYMDAIQPIIKMKAYIYNITLPKIIVYKNGEMKTEYNFTDEQQRTLNMLDEIIKLEYFKAQRRINPYYENQS